MKTLIKKRFLKKLSMMKTLRFYIFKQVAISFFIALVVFTFVLFIGTLLRLIEHLIGRIDITFIAQLFLYSTPYLLSYAIPMALLTSSLLVFGQMSADNEITAMRISGIRISKLLTGIIFLAILLSILCCYLNNIVLAKCHYEMRRLRQGVEVSSPAALLEAGTFIDSFEGYKLYVDEKEGNRFKNIAIHEVKENEPRRFIQAEEGELSVDKEHGLLIFKLTNGILEQPKENNPNEHYAVNFGTYTLTIDLEETTLRGKSDMPKRLKEMTIKELNFIKADEWEDYNSPDTGGEEKKRNLREISQISTEIHTKFSLAFSCISLVMIGIPLGIRAHRSEKTIGIPIALVLFAIYYSFIIFGKAISDKYYLHPDIIVWLPNIFLGALGVLLLYRIDRQ